jgi:hypothetical protein
MAVVCGMCRGRSREIYTELWCEKLNESDYFGNWASMGEYY